MKKALVAIALASLSTAAFAGVINSPHDLSASNLSSNYPNGQLSTCQFCHAPHNVNTGIQGTPLWNRGNAATASFTMYTSTTITPGAVAAQPNANSMTCLSCHDGATDMGDTFVGLDGFATPTLMNGGAGTKVVGADLGNDHPVSVSYAAGTALKATNLVATAGLVLYTNGANTTVECGSCHDPHTTVNPKFLRVAATSICTECHIK